MSFRCKASKSMLVFSSSISLMLMVNAAPAIPRLQIAKTPIMMPSAERTVLVRLRFRLRSEIASMVGVGSSSRREIFGFIAGRAVQGVQGREQVSLLLLLRWL